MSYLIFKEKGLATGAKKVAEQCTSAIFNYQVIGAGATVEFSGSNKPDYDIDDETHWQLIMSLQAIRQIASHSANMLGIMCV